ncbi:MAG: TonB-dependent receptor [Chromatiales bacterium]|nr:MAG: TonB-dependent receptor [Chromatiales bacterium]
MVALVHPAALAAEAFEEIIVTATKREQSIQDVSIAVTAWSGQQIRELNLEQSWEIARFTPGVNIASTSGGQDTQFTIRGVTQTDFNDSIEPPNAVYVDDGYMATVQGNRFGLFDINRVEVLRGPQGTLFGRNATGGLVHYITNRPGEEFEAYGDVMVGSDEQVRVEGALNTPINDDLAFRLSAVYTTRDELVDNKYPLGNVINPITSVPYVPSTAGQGDYWNDDSLGLRGQLLWKISDKTELLVSGFYWDEEISTNGSYEQGAVTAILDGAGRHVNTIFAKDDPQGCEALGTDGTCQDIDFVDGTFGAQTRPVQGGDLFGFVDPGGGGDQKVSADHSIDNFNTYEMYGLTARLTWDLGPALLTSITHYMDYDKRQSLDTDLAPVPQSVVMNENDSDTISQELRLSGETDRFVWQTGFYYLGFDNDNVIGFGFPPDSPITLLIGGVDPVFTGPFESNSFAQWDRDSYSLFGQVDYSLTDQWTFVLGGRIILEEADYKYRQAFYTSNIDQKVEDGQPPLNSFLSYPSFEDDPDDWLWAGRVVLEFRPNDELMFYGGVNRGTKAGGFNGKLNDFSPPLPTNDIPYDDETLYAYEIGVKSTLFDGTTRLNASAYYYDYEDYQAFVFVGASGFVRNADAETYGFEVELNSRPIDALDLSLSASYIDAEVQDLEIATDIIDDVEPPHTPEWQLASIVRYTFFDLLFNGDVTLQGAVTYTDERYFNIRNFDGQLMDDYTLVDARVSWTSDDDRWQVGVFGQNLTDEEYKVTGFDLATFCGCNEEAWGRPLWWGVDARVTF